MPPIRQFDLVLVFNHDDPEQNHMIAVVDTSNESLLIVKIVLQDALDLDKRNYNIYRTLG